MLTLALSSVAIMGLAVGMVQDDRRTMEFPVDFPGGSVTEFVEYSQGLLPDLNVIVDEDAADLDLPAFRVNLVGESDLEFASQLMTGLMPTLLVEQMTGIGPVPLLEVDEQFFGAGEKLGNMLFRVSISMEKQQYDGLLSKQHMIAMGIGKFLGKYGEEDLLAAVEAAMGAAVAGLDSEDWEIRYHEPTKVAFISVPVTRMEQADEASEQLRMALTESGRADGFGGESQAERQARLEKQQAFKMVSELNAKVESLLRENAMLREEIQSLKAEMRAALQARDGGRSRAAGGAAGEGGRGGAGGAGGAGEGGAGGRGGRSPR